MSQAFPLIRGGVLVPFLRWMRANGLPVEGPLRAADLPDLLGDDPDRPVPLASVLTFGHGLARRTSADIGARVLQETSLAELGSLGTVLLGARTPREALMRLPAVMNRHSTHELFAVAATPDGVIFREQMTLQMDAEVRHIEHQYVASVIHALCMATGACGRPFGRVEIAAHPMVAGLGHLHRWLGPELVPAEGHALSIFMPSAIIDRPFPRPPRDHGPLPDTWTALRGDGRYASTAQVVVEMMLEDGEPTVQRLAAASGVSLRTLQRRLAVEDTSFSKLLDDARQRRALQGLANGSASIGEIGAQLGYSGRPAFTRAVRRWASAPPTALRVRGKSGRVEG